MLSSVKKTIGKNAHLLYMQKKRYIFFLLSYFDIFGSLVLAIRPLDPFRVAWIPFHAVLGGEAAKNTCFSLANTQLSPDTEALMNLPYQDFR